MEKAYYVFGTRKIKIQIPYDWSCLTAIRFSFLICDNEDYHDYLTALFGRLNETLQMQHLVGIR